SFFWLFDQVMNIIATSFNLARTDNAIPIGYLVWDVLHIDNRAPCFFILLNKLVEHLCVVVQNVVSLQHLKRLISHKLSFSPNGMTEAFWLFLPNIVNIHIRRLFDFLQKIILFLFRQVLF